MHNMRALPAPRYLWNIWADTLLLGGASLLILPLLAWIDHDGNIALALIGLSFTLANVINHPHFAHSYLIFYRQCFNAFHGKNVLTGNMPLRYLWAGFLAPLLLALFFTWTIGNQNWLALGYAANAMFLLVGWHYAKQGYGMLMVDAALKFSFFKPWQKRLLLVNAYTCWALGWVQANTLLRTDNYFGVGYYTFTAPAWVKTTLITLAALTVSAVVIVLYMHAKKFKRNRWPVAGTVGYLASLYPWLVFTNPFLAYFIPAFHSLQYLAVTSKFEANLRASQPSKARLSLRLLLVAVSCIGLGYLGFFILPTVLDGELTGLEKNISIGTFTCWIFINTHHYFIDNVIWRKDNPETSIHLFKAAAAAEV